MTPYTWLLMGILVVGVLVIVTLGLHVRAAERSAVREATAAPDREIPQFTPERDPVYLSEGESHITPDGATPLTTLDDVLRANLDKIPRICGGLVNAEPGELTEQVVIEAPTVAVLQSGAESIREILPLIEASGGGTLVVVAPRLHPDIVDTLRANRTRRHLNIGAVVVFEPELARVCQLTGAQPISRTTLQSGWVGKALGTCRRWIADTDTSWVVPDDLPSGFEDPAIDDDESQVLGEG